MILYLCINFESNTLIFSKDIEMETIFQSWKRARTSIIIGGFYPKLKLTCILWLYTCIKFESNTLIFSKDTKWKPFVLRTGRTGRTDGMDGADVRRDCGNTICPCTRPPPPPTPPPRTYWNVRAIKKILWKGSDSESKKGREIIFACETPSWPHSHCYEVSFRYSLWLPSYVAHKDSFLNTN